MENGQNMNTSQTQEYFSMELVNERNDSKSRSEFLMNTMKNLDSHIKYQIISYI